MNLLKKLFPDVHVINCDECDYKHGQVNRWLDCAMLTCRSNSQGHCYRAFTKIDKRGRCESLESFIQDK